MALVSAVGNVSADGLFCSETPNFRQISAVFHIAPMAAAVAACVEKQPVADVVAAFFKTA